MKSTMEFGGLAYTGVMSGDHEIYWARMCVVDLV